MSSFQIAIGPQFEIRENETVQQVCDKILRSDPKFCRVTISLNGSILPPECKLKKKNQSEYQIQVQTNILFIETDANHRQFLLQMNYYGKVIDGKTLLSKKINQSINPNNIAIYSQSNIELANDALLKDYSIVKFSIKNKKNNFPNSAPRNDKIFLPDVTPLHAVLIKMIKKQFYQQGYEVVNVAFTRTLVANVQFKSKSVRDEVFEWETITFNERSLKIRPIILPRGAIQVEAESSDSEEEETQYRTPFDSSVSLSLLSFSDILLDLIKSAFQKLNFKVKSIRYFSRRDKKSGKQFHIFNKVIVQLGSEKEQQKAVAKKNLAISDSEIAIAAYAPISGKNSRCQSRSSTKPTSVAPSGHDSTDDENMPVNEEVSESDDSDIQIIRTNSDSSDDSSDEI